MASTVASRKAKGRLLQKEVVTAIRKFFPSLHIDDVTSRSMGAAGEDILLSPAARRVLPISVECKATESFNVADAYGQALENAGNYEPVVIHRRNRTKALAIVDMNYFIELHSDNDRLANIIINLQQKK